MFIPLLVLPKHYFISTENQDMDVDFHLAGWFSVWHCIQPFVAIIIVFFSMNYRELNRCPEIPKGQEDCIKKCISVVPIPALTNIYMFYLKWKSYLARSKPRFRKEMDVIESQIKNYEAVGTLERINSYISLNKLLFSGE